MENLEYYIKPINEFRETQCQSDLLNGKIKIADVPFIFRGNDEYTAAHKYARGLVDEKESYYLYWKIAECMESDMIPRAMLACTRRGLGFRLPVHFYNHYVRRTT